MDRVLSFGASAAEACASREDAENVRATYAAAARLVAQANELRDQALADQQRLAGLVRQIDARRKAERAPSQEDLDAVAATAEKHWLAAADLRRKGDALIARGAQAAATLTRSRNTIVSDLDRLRAEWKLSYAPGTGFEHPDHDLPQALKSRLDAAAAFGSVTLPANFGIDGTGAAASLQQAEATALKEKEAVVARVKEAAANPSCRVTSLDADVTAIGEAASRMAGSLLLASDLLTEADACARQAACRPLLRQVEPLLDAGDLDKAETVIAQARAQKCDVTGAEAQLDYHRTLHDGRRVILNAVAQCQFADALALAEKMPASFRQQAPISNAVIDARRGRAAELEVDKRVAQARTLTDRASDALRASRCADVTARVAQAEAELHRADTAVGAFACLSPRIEALRDELNALRSSCGGAPPPPAAPAPPTRPVPRSGAGAGTETTPRPPVPRSGGRSGTAGTTVPAPPPVIGDGQAPNAPAAPLRASLDCGPALQLRPGRPGEICDVIVTGWLTSTSAPVRVDIAFTPSSAGVSASPGNTASDPGTMHSTAASDYPQRYVFHQGFAASERAKPGTTVMAQIVVSQTGHGRVVLPLQLSVVPANTPYGDGSGGPVPPAVVAAGSGGDLCVWRYKLTGDAPRCFHVAIAQCGRYGPPYELIGANMSRSEAGARADQISRYFNDELGCRSTVTPPTDPPGPPTPPNAPPTPPRPPVPPPVTPDPPRPTRTLSRFGIEPRDVTLKAGETITLRALGIWSNAPASTVDLTGDVRWSPSNRITTTAADAGRRIVVTAIHPEGTDSITISVAAAAPVETVPAGLGGRGGPPPPPPGDPPGGGRGAGAGPAGGPPASPTPVSADVASRLQQMSGAWYSGNADVCWSLTLSASGGDASGSWSYAGKIKHQESGSFQASYKNGELTGTFTGSWHSPGCLSCNKGESGGREGTITISLGLESIRITTVEGKGSAVFTEGTTRMGTWTRKACK